MESNQESQLDLGRSLVHSNDLAMDNFAFNTLGPLLYSFHLDLDKSYTEFSKQQKALYQVDYLLQKMVEMKNNHASPGYAVVRGKLERARISASKSFNAEFLHPFRLKSLAQLSKACEQGEEQLEEMILASLMNSLIWKGSFAFNSEDLRLLDSGSLKPLLEFRGTLYGGICPPLVEAFPELLFKERISLPFIQAILSKNSQYYPLVLLSHQIEDLLVLTNKFSNLGAYLTSISTNQKIILLPFIWLFDLDLLHLYSGYLLLAENPQRYIPCLLIPEL